MFHTSTQREHWLFDSPSVLEAHRVSVYKRAVADIKKVYEQAGGGGPADEDFLNYEVCVCVSNADSPRMFNYCQCNLTCVLSLFLCVCVRAVCRVMVTLFDAAWCMGACALCRCRDRL